MAMTGPSAVLIRTVYRTDTIVACATASGHGAVAVIRLSGARAFAIADQLFVPRRASAWEPWKLRVGQVHDPTTKEPVDDALSVRMPGPATYTGEDVVELHCHGAPIVVERVIACALRSGARAAGPGEFTRRAVLNGRMDLVQAEAVADLVGARFQGAARAAWTQLQGALSVVLGDLRAEVMELLAAAEANVDFGDEDVPDADVSTVRAALDGVQQRIEKLLASFAVARQLRDGHTVVFTGKPNVGKSSLINALLGYGRMIVSNEPGTTRDTVEELVDLDGMAFVLTDTAGMRRARGAAERAAVDRARRKLHDADIVVVVVDGSRPLSANDRSLLRDVRERPGMVIVNKTDLPGAFNPSVLGRLAGANRPTVLASALTHTGCERICHELVRIARRDDAGETESVLISRARHRAALERVHAALGAARRMLDGNLAEELLAVELRAALTELASITDPVDNEQVLDRIFEAFCIGK